MIDWPAIYRAARDNCIREYLRYRRRHDDNSKWLRAYWRRRALSRAEEYREATNARRTA